jgi:hypothetical protein
MKYDSNANLLIVVGGQILHVSGFYTCRKRLCEDHARRVAKAGRRAPPRPGRHLTAATSKLRCSCSTEADPGSGHRPVGDRLRQESRTVGSVGGISAWNVGDKRLRNLAPHPPSTPATERTPGASIARALPARSSTRAACLVLTNGRPSGERAAWYRGPARREIGGGTVLCF